MAPVCLICGAPEVRFCKRCNSSAYCSVPCQETDFPVHKVPCKSFSEFADDARPSPRHRRAIYAPLNEKQPRFIWVSIKPGEPGHGHDRANITQLLRLRPTEQGDITRHPTHIRGNALRGRKEANHHTIELWERGDGIRANWPINSSLSAIEGHAWKDWLGPLVIMSKAGKDSDPTTYIDVTMSDFRDAADYIQNFHEGIGSAIDGLGNQSQWSKRVLEGGVGKTQVVRVACHAQQASSSLPAFSTVMLPKTHPAFRMADDPPAIAAVLGVDLSAYREKTPPALRADKSQPESLANPMITSLYVNVSHSHFVSLGGVEKEWSRKVGNVLVLRRDRRDLSIEWVQALCEFCRLQVAPRAQACHDNEMAIEHFHTWIEQEAARVLPH